MSFAFEMAINNFDDFIADVWTDLPLDDPFKRTWESGFWKDFFCNDLPVLQMSPLTASMPPWQPEGMCSSPEPQAKKLRRSSDPTDWRAIVHSNAGQSWEEKRNADFQSALKRWLSTLLEMPSSIKVVELLKAESTVAEQLRMLRDLFWKKAPHTLKKRIHSLLRYVGFLRSEIIPFPGIESDLYRFLKNEQDQGAPTSRLQSVLQSLSFCMHVLGIDEVQELCKSKRCHGIAGQRNAGPSRQADPFTVAELECIHLILGDRSCDRWDRAFAGTILAMTYSRSRWNDLQQAEDLYVDRDFLGQIAFLEFKISQHKCRHSSAFKNCFLPAVCPASGIVNDCWTEDWLEVRSEIGIDFTKGHPTFPAPTVEGDVTVRPLSTAEMKKWLHVLLDKYGCDLSSRQLSSHSCKRTLLTWLAKFGSPWQDRMILGGHASFMHSPIIYSRDAMARPLQILQTVLNAVRDKTFVPDNTRSGRFVAHRPVIFQEQDDNWEYIESQDQSGILGSQTGFEQEHVTTDFGLANVDTELLGIDANGLGDAGEDHGQRLDVKEEGADNAAEVSEAETIHSDVFTTSSESDEDAAALSSANRPVRPPKHPDGYKMIQHQKLLTIHLLEEGYHNVMACGRSVTERYGECSTVRWDTPCCHVCWKKASK